MKMKVIALLLTGGLMVGLCGCGGNGSSSVAGAAAQAETEDTPIAISEEPKIEEDYSVDDLIDMWSSGELNKEELQNMVDVGNISHETSEEFLAYMSENEAFDNTSWEDNTEDGNNTSHVVLSSLLTTYVLEFEDYDGYQIRETIQLSPIFTKDDVNVMLELWETLGNDITSFPSKESLQNENRTLTNYELEYVVGTYMVENLTDGFHITSDNPRTYIKSLTAEGHENAATLFNDQSVSVVAYSDGVSYYADAFAAVLSEARMTSDTWGPCSFVVALPNTSTPNQPNGYRYDDIQIIFGYNIYGSYDHSSYDTLKLNYYTKGVEK